MKVSLVAVTKPLVEGIETADALIAYCARISNPSNQLNTETAARLIAYCLRNKHFSIFEQADMTVEVQTSRAIAAQILRHRSFTFQEWSLRYSEAIGIEQLEWRSQGKTNRQVGDAPMELSRDLQIAVEVAQGMCLSTYHQLIEAGAAKECARMVLPLNTTTRLYMKGSVRSWIHYLEVRQDSHAQKEHRDIANAIREIFDQQFPMVARALKSMEGEKL